MLTQLSVGRLRQAWRERSAESAWAFPSDWYTPAVDALCEQLCAADGRAGSDGLTAAAWRLGRERARAAVCLAETLRDVDTLSELVPLPSGLTRTVALGWADGCAGAPDGVVDALTGLTSPAYLVVRIAEVYRAAEVEGSSPAYGLVVVRLPGDGTPDWARDLPMILVADGMRAVFAGGETLSRLGPSVAAALVPRQRILGRRARTLAELVTRTMYQTDQAQLAPQVWIEQLPADGATVPQLLKDLAR